MFASTQVSFAETLSHQQLLKNVDAALGASEKAKDRWYPSYHFASNGASIRDVSALTGFNDKYHMFFQQSFEKDNQIYDYWGHVESTDFINWKKLPSALIQYTYYDKSGIANGSAIVHDDLFYILYTGKGSASPVDDEVKVESKNNVSDEKNKNADVASAKIISTQNIATSKDGLYFGRSANNPVIKPVILNNKHEFSDENFANPFVWKKDDSFYALVGTQYKKTKDGAVLLFKSKDLRNWDVVNVSAIGQKGEVGYMWEAPAFFNVNGHDVLTISPIGIKPHGNMFLNKKHAGAFVGKLDYNTGKFAQKGAFMLYDYGFDFSVPKFMKTNDDRIICLAFMGMDGTDKLEKGDNWSGLLTIPREVKVVNGKLHTVPAKEVEALRLNKLSVHTGNLSGEKDVLHVKNNAYELVTSLDLTNSKSFSIKFKYDVSKELILSYDKATQILKLDRSKAGEGLSGEREVVLPLFENKLNLRIFADNSSVEIFANNGPVAMTTRIYPEKNSTSIKFISDGNTKVERLDFYKLKPIQ